APHVDVEHARFDCYLELFRTHAAASGHNMPPVRLVKAHSNDLTQNTVRGPADDPHVCGGEPSVGGRITTIVTAPAHHLPMNFGIQVPHFGLGHDSPSGEQGLHLIVGRRHHVEQRQHFGGNRRIHVTAREHGGDVVAEHVVILHRKPPLAQPPAL